MTRTEEIEKKAHQVSYNTDEYESFIFGAEWADETMIKKAKEWLEKTLYIHTELIEDKHWGETKSSNWVTSDYDSVEDFINGFCKAMEE
jgi:hypothetical protein